MNPRALLEDAKALPLSSLMSSPVLSVRVKAPVREAARLMTAHGVGALAVLDASGRGVGVLSASDVLRSGIGGTVEGIYTPGMITAPEGASLGHAAWLMGEKRIHRVFVTRKGRVVGVVSAFDVAKAVGRSSGPVGSAWESWG